MSFKAIKYDFGNEVHLAWYNISFDKRYCAQEVLPTFTPTDGLMNPFLKLTQQDAQSLINALYEAGVRPSSLFEPKDWRAISDKVSLGRYESAYF